MPVTTAIHSRRKGVTKSTSSNVAIHNGLVAASTRSPALNTGPLPALIWLTTRKLMKPSSFMW
ncbi:MAG: hypothetical protein E6G60_22170 [Actinobacteria bacterium]|nr:MAG: hypothetical protein E6G60_22170 [Actinomycetota bacterium]